MEEKQSTVFNIVKYSRSRPSALDNASASPSKPTDQARRTKETLQWVHYTKPKLYMIVDRMVQAYDQPLTSIRVVWDQNGMYDSNVTSIHPVDMATLEDIVLNRFATHFDGSRTSEKALKGIFKDEVVALRYAVSQGTEGSFIYNRMQARFCSTSDAQAFVTLVEPFCPCKPSDNETSSATQAPSTYTQNSPTFSKPVGAPHITANKRPRSPVPSSPAGTSLFNSPFSRLPTSNLSPASSPTISGDYVHHRHMEPSHSNTEPLPPPIPYISKRFKPLPEHQPAQKAPKTPVITSPLIASSPCERIRQISTTASPLPPKQPSRIQGDQVASQPRSPVPDIAAGEHREPEVAIHYSQPESLRPVTSTTSNAMPTSAMRAIRENSLVIPALTQLSDVELDSLVGEVINDASFPWLLERVKVMAGVGLGH